MEYGMKSEADESAWRAAIVLRDSFSRSMLLALFLLGVLGLPGCMNENWAQSVEEIGSVDEAGQMTQFSVIGLTKGGRAYLVMAVADCTSPKSVTGSTTNKGELVFSSHRKMDWSCTSPDAHTGTLTIDQQSFDLAKGGVFLVRQQDGKIEVKQLAADISKIQGTRVAKQLEALGRTEPAIADFFQLARKTK